MAVPPPPPPAVAVKVGVYLQEPSTTVTVPFSLTSTLQSASAACGVTHAAWQSYEFIPSWMFLSSAYKENKS